MKIHSAMNAILPPHHSVAFFTYVYATVQFGIDLFYIGVLRRIRENTLIAIVVIIGSASNMDKSDRRFERFYS